MDRERQASALAAAGMVAERVSRTQLHDQPVTTLSHPALAMNHYEEESKNQPHTASDHPLSHNHGSGAGANLTMAWDQEYFHTPTTNSHGNGCSVGVIAASDTGMDDMEMDFAKMFDPQMEVDAMNTEGSGWPVASAQVRGPVDSTSLLGKVGRE